MALILLAGLGTPQTVLQTGCYGIEYYSGKQYGRGGCQATIDPPGGCNLRNLPTWCGADHQHQPQRRVGRGFTFHYDDATDDERDERMPREWVVGMQGDIF